MTEYLTLLTRKDLFLQRLDDELSQADSFRDIERNAGVSIQRVYRGSLCRYDVSKKHYAAGEIQRVFRGHLGRKKSRGEAKKKMTVRQLHYINYLVMQLQKCFRGYYSRRYKRDHSQRKRYCRIITEKGHEILEKMKQYSFGQTEREAEEAKIKRDEEFKVLAENLHHLISTRQIRGIYNPLLQLIAQPTMNQKPIEEHIRGVVKDLLRTRGITKRGLVEDINGTLKIPIKGMKYRLSLQASVPYDTVRNEQLREKLLHRILISGKGSFMAGGRTELINHNETPLAVGDPYLDPWANPMLVKGVPANQQELLDSAKSQKALFVKHLEKPFVTRVGGNRSTTLPNDVFDVIAEAEETGGAVHRHLGTRTSRFGLSASMDARSAAASFNFDKSSTGVPNGYTNPPPISRDSATLRSTQRRVKTYSSLSIRTKPNTTGGLKSSGQYHLNTSKVPFDKIAEANEDSTILSNVSGGEGGPTLQKIRFGQHPNNLLENADDSSDEEDDFRG